MTLAVARPYRNPSEEEFGNFLSGEGIAFDYEPMSLPVDIPARTAKYKPDFIPNGTNIILEYKGAFGGGGFGSQHDKASADYRHKMILFKEQHPEWDLRFVFCNPSSKIYKGSKTTYAQWATDHGFLWCKSGKFPAEWIAEIKQQQGAKPRGKPRRDDQYEQEDPPRPERPVRRKSGGRALGAG